MRRNPSQPVDAAVFHRGFGIEAFGDGVGDEGLTLFRQPVEQRALFLDQSVNTRRFVVQKLRDAALGFQRRKWQRLVTNGFPICARHLRAKRCRIHRLNEALGSCHVKKIL